MKQQNENFTWIKLYRKSLESSVWKNPNIWMVWSWCLLKANHEKHLFPFNGSDVEIKEGQFITGINKAIKELPITAQTYRTCITYLKSTDRITAKSNNKFSIITIVNWAKYQPKDEKLTGKLTNEQQATNKPLTTYKKEENDNNDKKTAERLSFLTSSLKWKRELRKWRAGGGRTIGDYIFTENDGEQLLMKKDENGKKVWLTYKDYKSTNK